MSNLTKWEIGQDLIAASDYLAEKIDDIKADISEEDLKTLNYALALIGNVFNNNNDHKFGIYDSTNWAKEYPYS